MIPCVVVAAAAALAVSALQSPEAAPRPAQATSACSEPAIEPKSTPQPRPSYPEGARQLAGTRVVVHYAAAGPNAPPSADQAPANGVPDYVEKVRNAADASYAFFERPDFQGQRFQGFGTAFSDTAGPDQRLDIYLAGRGRPLGRAVPPTRGEGGAFMVLSTSLADRPRGGAQQFKGDGIRFTVAHELFHIVQFGYVPSGMPLWVAEGTANTLAFLFEDADHPFLKTQADVWLKKPDCALWYEDFNCDRCYGGVWWWTTYRYVLRLYFDHLARHARDGFGVGQGVGALEAAFQGLAPAGTFVTPHLFLDFAFSFAPPLAMAAYSQSKGKAPFTTSILPRPRKATKAMTLNPMSAHYIGVRVPPGTRALELVATGIDGPDPLQTLLLGVSRGPKKTVRVARDVSPCVATFLPGYGTFADLITVNFHSNRERKQSVLVVANRTNRLVHYTLSHRTLAKTVRKPSPATPWGAKSNSKSAFCGDKAVTRANGSDAAGDAELGAPDLTQIDINLTRTPGNTRPLISFVVDFPNRRELEGDDSVWVSLDTDQNPKTGCLQPLGIERVVIVRGIPGPDASGLARCVGGELVPKQNDGMFQARFDETKRRLVILTTPDDLDGATVFNFVITAFWEDRASNEVRLDFDGPFCFPTCPGSRLR